MKKNEQYEERRNQYIKSTLDNVMYELRSINGEDPFENVNIMHKDIMSLEKFRKSFNVDDIYYLKSINNDRETMAVIDDDFFFIKANVMSVCKAFTGGEIHFMRLPFSDVIYFFNVNTILQFTPKAISYRYRVLPVKFERPSSFKLFKRAVTQKRKYLDNEKSF